MRVEMETNYAKELDSRHRLMAELKRKRVGQFETYITGATRMALPPQSTLNSSLHKFSKWRKLDESKFHCGRCTSQPKRSLLKYYSNFKKSGLPQRLMCYRNGEWTDFPQEVVSLVKKDFQIKRAATEVELDGHLFVIDFLHMMKLDLKTGMQEPIAWIDESGACFFPETFSDHDKIHECCYHEYEEDQGHLVPKPHGSNGSNDIKLQLEIDISGLDFSKLKESSGESNDIVSQIQVVQKPAMDAEADNSCIRVSNEEVCEAFGENQQEENLVLLDPFCGDLNSNTVQEMFLKGLSSFMKAYIVEVSSGSGIVMQARWELFQKQVEITKRYRGDANVRYAWLPSSKEALSSVMTYGLGDCGITKSKSTYGIGVLLLPANCTQSRSVYFLTHLLML